MPRRPMAKRATAADGSTTVRGKRGNGAGSIYFDQTNDCYFATWRDADGKRRKVRGRSQVEAEGRRVLGPPKSEGAEGVHYLLPGVVDRLRAHCATQAAERLAAGPAWQNHYYGGERLDLVFTTEDGGIVARQHVDKLTRAKAAALGIDTTGLGTHVGRRTVVTAMSEDGVPLDDIARHVGDRSATTTAGYVRSHKERDRATREAAASLLDVPAVQ